MRIKVTIEGAKFTKVAPMGTDKGTVEIELDCPESCIPKEGSDLTDNLGMVGPLFGVPVSAEDIAGFLSIAGSLSNDPDSVDALIAKLSE